MLLDSLLFEYIHKKTKNEQSNIKSSEVRLRSSDTGKSFAFEGFRRLEVFHMKGFFQLAVYKAVNSQRSSLNERLGIAELQVKKYSLYSFT